MLKQSKTFRDNAEEMERTLILDSNVLERERGITILAKNTAIEYNGYKINIIDTPGHADFGGEVERTLTMADGCILLIDAQEGPMPQTRFVLQKALGLGLRPIVLINKIDKPARRIREVEDETASLFLELAQSDDQLDYPIVYAVGRDGKCWNELPVASPEGIAETPGTLETLFETIVAHVPPPSGNPDAPLQMRVTTLIADDYRGTNAVGKIHRGTAHEKQSIVVCNTDGTTRTARIEGLFTWKGLTRVAASEAVTGDIVAIVGAGSIGINATICDTTTPEPLPQIAIEEPTLSVVMGANTSPFAGREGTFVTARQIRERVEKELETNIALRMEPQGEKFMLSGRGELHLSVLFETMRREGYEFEVGKPKVITKIVDGDTLEPYEEVIIDVPESQRGVIVSEMAKRRAILVDTYQHASDVRFVYEMPTRAILGLRTTLITDTRGQFVLNTRFLRFDRAGEPLQKARKGALIAHETGKALAFGLDIAQGRGTTFISPGTEVYEGMVIGENARDEDLEVNVAKGKELTNMRSKSSDGLTLLAPPVIMTLEESLDFIEEDELLEITPKTLRIRKRLLTRQERDRAFREMKNAEAGMQV